MSEVHNDPLTDLGFWVADFVVKNNGVLPSKWRHQIALDAYKLKASRALERAQASKTEGAAGEQE
jgi:hypothetical protein